MIELYDVGKRQRRRSPRQGATGGGIGPAEILEVGVLNLSGANHGFSEHTRVRDGRIVSLVLKDLTGE